MPARRQPESRRIDQLAPSAIQGVRLRTAPPTGPLRPRRVLGSPPVKYDGAQALQRPCHGCRRRRPYQRPVTVPSMCESRRRYRSRIGPLERPVLEAYLRRLSLEAEPPSAEALTRLHRRHAERIPYETLWTHGGERRGINPHDAATRIAFQRRSGYCYHLNGAFAALLHALGYRVALRQPIPLRPTSVRQGPFDRPRPGPPTPLRQVAGAAASGPAEGQVLGGCSTSPGTRSA